MKNYRDKQMKCPFYVGEDAARHVIRCEGLGDSFYMEWGFGNREKERRTQMRAFCASAVNCEKCEMHRIIRASKYE